MTYVQGRREKAAHAKTPRRKERQERLPSWDRRNGRALRALRLCETLPLPQREKAAHAKTPRRKERQERLPSWDRRNGRALRALRLCETPPLPKKGGSRKGAKTQRKTRSTQVLSHSGTQAPRHPGTRGLLHLWQNADNREDHGVSDALRPAAWDSRPTGRGNS
jgi:hypothetical protein